MIWFEELQNRKKISRIFSVYEKTFPEDERRGKEQFLALSENPDVYIFSIKNDEIAIGYLIFWEISDFYFLEHFEVFEEFRNQKFGSEILTQLQEKYEKIMLEAEPKNQNEMAEKRIRFYEKNGFSILDENYLQPSYGSGKNELPLFLLSNFLPENISEKINLIHEKVYGIIREKYRQHRSFSSSQNVRTNNVDILSNDFLWRILWLLQPKIFPFRDLQILDVPKRKR